MPGLQLEEPLYFGHQAGVFQRSYCPGSKLLGGWLACNLFGNPTVSQPRFCFLKLDFLLLLFLTTPLLPSLSQRLYLTCHHLIKLGESEFFLVFFPIYTEFFKESSQSKKEGTHLFQSSVYLWVNLPCQQNNKQTNKKKSNKSISRQTFFLNWKKSGVLKSLFTMQYTRIIQKFNSSK